MKNKKLFAILTLVCFMMTLMPVAAFADAEKVIDPQESYVFTDDTDAEVDANSKGDDYADICFDFDVDDAVTTVYVWFVKDGSSVASTSVTSEQGFTANEGVFEVTNAKETGKYGFGFKNTGKYTVHAALQNPVSADKIGEDGKFNTKAEAFKNAEDELLNNISNQKTIEATSSSSSRDYATSATVDGKALTSKVEVGEGAQEGYYKDGAEFEGLTIQANNVSEKEVVIKVVDKEGKAVKGETVTLDTNSANIELNKEKATTDQLGQIKFKIAGVRDGDYKVYVKIGSYESTILVAVGATGAYDIKCVKSPSGPIDVTSDLKKKIEFTFTDANGNAVEAAYAAEHGAVAAFQSNGKTNGYEAFDGNAKPYVAIVSQPSASKLGNEDFYLTESENKYRAKLTLASGAKDLAEGTYEIKVVLDNGKYTTVTFEVKEFTTPVALNLTYEADAVELDSYVAIDSLEWVDANGVTKECTNKVDLAATGYAVETFLTSDTKTVSANGKTYTKSGDDKFTAGTVFVKDDDKYVGQTITVIAVDDRYNLTAQATLTVADEATELAFDTKTLAVDANNKVGVSVVDSQGNKVALNRGGEAKSASISYVVLDKPEGAKVSVNTDGSDNNILTEGTFKMNVVANKVGNVTIQAVAKVTYASTLKDQKDVVKYYTGTQIFAVGKDSVGDVVVMSIGSNEIIINDAKGTIDAAPMIQNDRTYVPFRALAEAFGATVAYDEATQAVTAELNGVTVVMTIGSATYTVNGAEKTMDVAPFITGSRTMIPVRFAAEAFGIKVIPTYNPDGSTADILFNL